MNITQSTDDQLMCIAAVRYCLGRRSYIVGSCLDWLQVHWPQFERKTQLVILRDIIEALMDDNAGSPSIDAPRWRTFAAWAWEQTDPQAQDWTRRAVSHKDGAWPLDEEQKSESRRVEP